MAKEGARKGGQAVAIQVDDLLLDPNNPRLPDNRTWNQETILNYIRENGELTELARSFADNGYFVQEPVLVVRKGRKFTVLEGNRRVATLKTLLDESATPFIDVNLSSKRRAELSSVPAVVLDDENELHRYVGFRHISGLQPWSAEAKARYLYGEVEAHRNADDPFKIVARRVGLQASQVRQAYIAYATLRHGSEQFGLEVGGVTDHAKKRFGVWMRAMESPAIRDFIGVGSPTDYEQVVTSLKLLEKTKKKLQEVVDDIGPLHGEPVLQDSRQVTLYARILGNDDALRAKRSDKNLEAAKEIVSRVALAERVSKIERTLDALTREVSALKRPLEEELLDAASRVRKAAIRFSGALKEVAAGDDE